MKKSTLGTSLLVLLTFATFTYCLDARLQACQPSGKIKGIKPPPGQCNPENDSDCCKQGKMYTTYKCSPPVTGNTKAVLTLNSFQKGGDGGGPSECDNQYHSDDTPVVALSTGWYSGGDRCLNYITISANGRSVKAKVVDECDSTSVTLPWDVMTNTIFSLHVRITLLMPLKQCGKPWVYLKVTGAIMTLHVKPAFANYVSRLDDDFREGNKLAPEVTQSLARDKHDRASNRKSL
ncbi:hypothetical protein HAX54_020643 [Datura stramonium]|uniref:Ripening-related protein 1 n=1 Tax=Datura stramonium TaxID=4076 RepID=A0ABS8S2Q0_DATST|nr:hypothetical protein [Datura stramonium]